MATSDFSQHISRQFNADLKHVYQRILAMGSLIEQQLNYTVSALLEGDTQLAKRVVQSDRLVNRMEVILDEECARILAIRAPAASDLRLVLAIIKASTDLERMGDECEKISRIASRLATQERPIDKYRQLKQLSGSVQGMVTDTLDAFARLDPSAAIKAARRDRLVDEEYAAIQRQAITSMMEDPRTIRQSLDVMWVARAFERIGDHSKNLCEHVVFLVQGMNIRHQ
jgi:phosphate transport system protein